MKKSIDNSAEKFNIRTSLTKGERRSQRHKQVNENRDIRTAYKQARHQKLQQLKLISTPIKAQHFRNHPILHQTVDQSCDGSVIMIPKKLQQARHPTMRQTFADINHHQRESSLDHPNYTEREQSPQWKAFSRKNIQQVNARLKSIRNNQYGNQNYLSQENSSTQLKNMKLKIASFVSKPIQQHHSKLPYSEVADKRQHQFFTNKSLGRNQRSQTQNKFIITDKITQRSKSVMGTEFYTKMKKKSLQNDPHLLATVIKHKSQKGVKQDLYRFVTRIIERSRK